MTKNQSKNKKVINKTCTSGVVIACCFGAVGFILTALGFVSAALIFNQYADYILMPLFGFFMWSLIIELKNLKNKTWFYISSLLGLVLTIYFSLNPINFPFILLGILLNYLFAKKFGKCK